ncbi:MAG: hypothetical protein FWE91_05640 [Defluviitaleaceae bacterium]|nr:hypothetical protein [Defluviitaleaceae bacterium]
MSNKLMNQAVCLNKSEASNPDYFRYMCDDDLAYILRQEETENIDLGKFIEHMKEFDIGSVGICAICGKHYTYGGHNPHPVVKDEGARCCARCYDRIVNKARSKVTSEILYKSKGRKPNDDFKLHANPNIIVNHVKRVDVMKVIAAPPVLVNNKSTFTFVDAEYKAPFFIFKQADTDDVVTIDKRRIVMSHFGANCMLYIYV